MAAGPACEDEATPTPAGAAPAHALPAARDAASHALKDAAAPSAPSALSATSDAAAGRRANPKTRLATADAGPARDATALVPRPDASGTPEGASVPRGGPLQDADAGASPAARRDPHMPTLLGPRRTATLRTFSGPKLPPTFAIPKAATAARGEGEETPAAAPKGKTPPGKGLPAATPKDKTGPGRGGAPVTSASKTAEARARRAALTPTERTCRGDACARAGLDYADARRGKRDPRHAAALFERACETGSAQGCGLFAMAVARGQGAPRDVPQAVDLYDRACRGGFAKACFNLALIVGNGQGVPRDAKRAAALLGQACEEGAVRGCSTLGAWYVAQGEDARGEPLLKKACDAGEPLGCAELKRKAAKDKRKAAQKRKPQPKKPQPKKPQPKKPQAR